jgi:hypothetical protein
MIALLVILAATPQDLPVEQTKKNIKVLEGLPSSQLIPVMSFMANSLGVTCAHCHGKEFDSDEKPAKDAARKMIALQRAINQQHYGGKLTVTCNTCHQGRVLPPATPDVADAGWNARPAAKPDDSISGEEAIERLFEATSEIKHRVIRGKVERYNGRDEPKSAPFTLTLGDTIEYHTELSHPPEATRAFALFPRGAAEAGAGERRALDHRRRSHSPPSGDPDRCSAICPREVHVRRLPPDDGGRLPFRVQWARADYRVTYTVDEVQDRKLQVLNDLPESQLFPAMNVLAQAIGVHCDYCHVKIGDKWIWASEEKPAKAVGREMIRMVLDLNRGKFKTTCYSCHRGSTSVATVIPLPPRDHSIAVAVAAERLPSAEELLTRYAEATGLRNAVKPLTLTGRLDSKARSGTLRVTLTPPDDVAIELTTATDVIRQSPKGTVYEIDKVHVKPSDVVAVRAERIDDRDVYAAEVRDGSRTTTYYFDKRSGLLLRRLSTTETILGPLAEQTEFSDYRNIDGVQLPFTIRTSDGAPFATTTRTFTSVTPM